MGGKVPAIYGESYDSAKAKAERMKRRVADRGLRGGGSLLETGPRRRRRRGAASCRRRSRAPSQRQRSVAGQVQPHGTAVIVLEPKTARTFPAARRKSR